MSDSQAIELRRAHEQISSAMLAFHGFMELVKGGEALNGEMLYCLLEPVEDRFQMGLDQIDSVLHPAG